MLECKYLHTKFVINTFPKIELLCLYLGGKLNQEIDELLNKLYGKMNLPKYPFDLL